METFLTVTDFLLLLFWVRLWSQPDRELYFNPFLSAPTRLTDRVLDFLRPALPLPRRLMALLLLLFLLVFRAVALNHFRAETPWVITLGSVLAFSPREPGVPGALTFSALHFLFFIVHYWGVYVLIQLLTPIKRRDRASEAFRFAALPLSALNRWLQLLMLAVITSGLVYGLAQRGSLALQTLPGLPAPQSSLQASAETAHRLLFYGGLTILSMTDSLIAATNLMFVFILGGLASLVLQNALVAAVSNEGVNVLLGRFSRRMLMGMMDLTPIFYFFALGIAYTKICQGVLYLLSTLTKMI